MKIILSNNLTNNMKSRLQELWNNEYPEKIKHSSIKDFEDYLNELQNLTHYLMIDDNSEITGWGFTFDRNAEKWFAIILDSRIHGKGFGTELLKRMKQNETELFGWVIDHNNDLRTNGQAYRSPVGFYIKNGFKIIPDERLELEKISAVKIIWQKK